MTRLFLAGLMASTVITGTQAASIDFDSDVTAVTVFPAGAQVTRFGTGTVEPGEHTIIIDDLPEDIDPASVRVDGLGDGITIGSVDVRRTVVGDGVDPQRRKQLSDQIQALRDEQRLFDLQLTDMDAKRALLEMLIKTAVTPRKDAGASLIDASDLMDVFDMASMRLSDLSAQRVKVEMARRNVSAEIETLGIVLQQLAPTSQTRTEVAINVRANATSEARFDVRYNVAQAGWRAIYDASIDLIDGADDLQMAIKRRALVQQATTESWDNIALTLSTARPSSATAAPFLGAQVIDEQAPIGYARSKISDGQSTSLLEAQAEIMAAQDGIVMAAPAPMREQMGTMTTGGFQATYEIAGAVTVSNDREDKSVLIGIDDIAVDVMALAVPSLDPTAYLIADFTLTSEATYLPGEVLLTRNGTFLGRGNMPLLAPGDKHQLGFGADDFVKVERVDLDRTKGETGIISTTNVDAQTYRITVENLHDFAMPVRVIDRVPVSNHEDIRIEMLAGMTAASQSDVDGQRGVLAWDETLEAGASYDILLGYKLSWPADMAINLAR